MGHIIALFAVFLIVAVVHTSAQTGCCAPTGTQEFAALGSAKDFQTAHIEPEALKMEDGRGERIQVDVEGGESSWVRIFKADQSPKATIIVIHEWWGVNEQVTLAAEKLYTDLNKQVDVVVVDLYDGLVATTREAAGAAMQSVDEDRSEDILKAVINMARSEQIGTLGWCFGGGWSLRASLLAGNKAAACVMYYGMPVKSVDELKKLNAPVLGVFAAQDKWITPEVVKTFESNMMSAEKMLKIRMYDADHAFANPSNPQFDKTATADAWETSLEFFRLHLSL